jgi:hypothetical protein
MSNLNFISDTHLRKALEKVYARVFDLSNGVQRGKMPEVTPDGKLLLLQAKVEPEDIVAKTMDDFLNMVDSPKG